MLLANLLREAGIDCVVVDRSSRDDIFRRSRAGLIEWRSVQIMREHGLADRLLREGVPHGKTEFRFAGQSVVVDYGQLYGGRTHWVYPQHEVVSDLQDAFAAAGGEAHYEQPAVKIELGEPAVIHCDGLRVECGVIAGCDGFHGVCRTALPAGAAREYHKDYTFAWLATLATVAPSTEHIIYALHPSGFAGHMLRTPTVCRFYLQVPHTDLLSEWPDERIWAELHTRLALPGWTLREGPIFDRTLFPMASHVTEPMQCGPLFLTGDAAHIITPAGAKGMNLALQDAAELAAGLIERARTGDNARLDAYSATRLPRIWRAQEFSYWMVTALHPGPDDDPFTGKLREARLDHLRLCESFAANFAENYVGLL
jgi:p-hydroxybenzoate 3-monooxygenase